MSYVIEQLQPGEKIVYRARVRLIAYLYAIGMFALIMSPGPFSALASTELVLTNKRHWQSGKVVRKLIAMPYDQIETVSVRRSPLGVLFDYGYVMIRGKDGSKIIFKGIIEPLDVQIQINESIEVAVLGRKLSQTVME